MRGQAAVQKLADQAIANMNLTRNKVKGDWSVMSTRKLTWLFLREVWELWQALGTYKRARKAFHYILVHRSPGDCVNYIEAKAEVEQAANEVKHEAGDCMAFLSMIVERMG